MYKSSSQTFIFKYIHPFFIIFGGLFGIYALYNFGGQGGSGFIKAFCIAYLWTFIFLIQVPFRLKSLEADVDGVKIISRNTKELIKYKNIEYISKFDLAAPWFTTIKYKDDISNLSKKIAFIPSPKDQVIFKEDNLSSYIKANMKLHVPHYHDSMHPSTFKNMGRLFLLATPVIGLMLYFMKDIFFQ